MTNQDSTTTERERIARTLYEASPVDGRHPLSGTRYVVPWDEIKRLNGRRAARAYREADAILSGPSRMAASSEEPTEDMLLAGAGVWLGGTVHAMSDEWRERMRLTWNAMLAARPDTGREVADLDWKTIADERGKIAADLGARLVLARMAIENAVDVLRNRGRFGSPDDALANLSDTLAALRSGATPPVAVPVSEEADQLRVRARIPGLRGKNIGCWCRLDQVCHGDVLLRLANADGPKGQDGPSSSPGMNKDSSNDHP